MVPPRSSARKSPASVPSDTARTYDGSIFMAAVLAKTNVILVTMCFSPKRTGVRMKALLHALVHAFHKDSKLVIAKLEAAACVLDLKRIPQIASVKHSYEFAES